MEDTNERLLASRKKRLKIFTIITIVVEVLLVLTIIVRLYGYQMASFIFDFTPSASVHGSSMDIEFKSKLDLGQDINGDYYTLGEIKYSNLDSDFVVLKSAKRYPDIVMTDREGDVHQINKYSFSGSMRIVDLSFMMTTEALNQYPQLYSEDGKYEFYLIDYDNDVLMSAQQRNMRQGFNDSLFVFGILGAVFIYVYTPIMAVAGVVMLILQIVFRVRYNKLKKKLSSEPDVSEG